MDVCLSHLSALEVLRSPEYLGLARSWSESVSRPPDAIPPRAEVAELLGSRITAPFHLLVSSDARSRSNELVCRHVSARRLPTGSFVRVASDVLVSCPELVCLQMATLCSDLELVLLASELCGLYAVTPKGELLDRGVPLTSRERILAYVPEAPHVRGLRALQRAMPKVIENAASPMEVKLALRLGLPPGEGGYGLPIESLNEEFVVRALGSDLADRRRKPDILLLRPDGRAGRGGFRGICIDYDGRGHLSERQHVEDDVRRNELLAAGFKPYTVKKAAYDDLGYMDGLAGAVAADLGVELAGIEGLRGRRQALFADLERIDGISWGAGRISGTSGRRARPRYSGRIGKSAGKASTVEAKNEYLG